MSECVDLVISLAKQRGREIPDEELELLIKNFEAEKKRRSIKSVDDLLLVFDMADKNTTEMRLAARQAKREALIKAVRRNNICLLYTSPSPRDKRQSRMPSSA